MNEVVCVCVFCVCAATACLAAPSAPQDGTVSFSDGDAHGSVATFACKVGFAQAGDTKLTCAAPIADAAWPAAADAPTCHGENAGCAQSP